MKYGNILGLLFDQPWAIQPEKLDTMVLAMEMILAGNVPAELVSEVRASAPNHAPIAAAGAVAVVPVLGVLSHRASGMASGGTATRAVAASVQAAADDPNVSAIVLDMETPGGSVGGIPEAGAVIRAANQRKPVVAQINTYANSAGYWLASQAGEIVISPSGEAGSIGVIAKMMDRSASNEKAGVRVTTITAGDFKGLGDPDSPITDEAIAHVQERVQQYYRMFIDAVAVGRKITAERVLSHFGQGKTFGAEEALSRGMVDKIGTLQETLAALAPKPKGPTWRTEAGLPALQKAKMLAL